MATAALVDDEASMNRFNPYTWSGSYGVNTDGFPKDLIMDGSYTTEIDETPMRLVEPVNDPVNLPGNVYLKTVDVNPAPFTPFPARKYEWEDGTTSWFRPGQTCAGAKGRGATLPTFNMKEPEGALLWLLVAALALYLATKLR